MAVDEETVRLESHLSALEEILRSQGAVGRKLDFLVQEMNREANTIGSKAQDIEIARVVVDIKAEIEANTEKIKLLKNVNTCPGCGAEVPKTSKFCDKCGTPIVVTSTEPLKEDEEVIDAEFSEASGEEKAAEEKAEPENGEAKQEEASGED